ncbi:MAG: flippase-like domain-containing protein [Deltaproteobacteria bacterium]|nr:flippase-like domain-containing protein [Deltaproteobacteria bacterium]
MAALDFKDWKIAGTIVSILLLVLAFWNVDFAKLLSVTAGAALLPIAAVAAINFVVVALKAYRWKVVLAATKNVGFPTVLLTTLVGFMANNVLPARAGELVRIIVLGKKAGISKTTVLGTLALDRVFEGVGMLVVLAALPFLIETPDWMRKGTLVFVILMTAVLAVLIVMVRLESGRWVTWIPVSDRWSSFLQTMAAKLKDGLRTINNARATAIVLLVSAAVWFLQGLMVHLCLESIGLHFGLTHALFILMVINLAIMAPAAPGNIGTFEFSAMLALGYLGVDPTPALSFALIYHFVQMIPLTLVGIIALPALGIRLADIRRGDGDVERGDRRDSE